MGGEIPIIDIQGDKNELIKIKEACEKWGCFRVINHGVPKELMAEIKTVAINSFNRPAEIKQRTKVELPGSGYVASTPNNPVYEALGLDFVSSDCFSSFCSDLELTPYQREIMEKYSQAIHKLGTEIASKITAGISGIEDNNIKVSLAHFRMNKYSITPDTIGSHGLPTHTDASLITILQDDDHLAGLEIVDPFGNLVPVDCFPGSFVINLGDIAVPWSNGKLRTLPHRVVCKDVGVRVSIATIITPATDEEENIVAHPNFLEDGCAPKYAPFKHAEYRKLRHSMKIYSGEMLDTFALEQPESP